MDGVHICVLFCCQHRAKKSSERNMCSKNIPNVLKARETKDGVNKFYQSKLQVYDKLVKRLGLEIELQGHEGCVNCLEWNQDGSLLASGSDDHHAIVWDPFCKDSFHKIGTGHNGNIFSVKFMPNSGDHVLATGAADSQVRVHSVTSKDPIQVFFCHDTRVKRLATSQDCSHIIWSASEDGTVRQFDLREPHVCQSNVQPCKNVLIDLNIHIGAMCEAKCIEINPCQSELIAVGCNDPFVRLYDRRMLSRHCTSESGVRHCGLETCQKDTATLPRGCVRYFTPGHLPDSPIRRSARAKKRSVVATYLTFGSNGRELLVNLGGEQLYLFDVRWHDAPLWYTASSFSTDAPGTSSRNGIVHDDTSCVSKPAKAQCSTSSVKSGLNGSTNGYTIAKATCKERQVAAGTSGITVDTYQMPAKAVALKAKANEQFDGKNYWAAINLYNQALNVAPNSSVLFSNRAAAYMKRGWYGDIYAALRDCHEALKVDSSNSKASYRQARCLFELEWFPEADACLKRFKINFPDECSTKLVRTLERDINAAMFSETEDTGEKASKESSSSRRSEIPVSRRRRNVVVTNECERELRKTSYDYKKRFCGHCNTTTDIKEANFFGAEGDYIVAGSDDGSFFIWEKNSTNLMNILKGDESIVNCLQPHPSVCLLATSGIDPVIRLWSPQAEEGEADMGLGVPVNEFAQVTKDNQRRMKTDPFEVMLLNLGYTTTREGSDESEGESGHVPIQCHTS